MHLPHEKLPEWDSADSSMLRTFLETPTGRKLFPLLLAAAPSIKGVALEEVALQGKQNAGYLEALEDLSSLAAISNEKPEIVPNPYPSLDADEHWPQELTP